MPPQAGEIDPDESSWETYRDGIAWYENGSTDNESISVTGLYGVAVWFPLGPRIEPVSDDDSNDSDDTTYWKTKPCIDYRSFEMLTDPGWWFSRSKAFVPIQIGKGADYCHADTDEPWEDEFGWPSFDYETTCTRFETARRHWDNSELFAQVKTALRSARLPPGISKIVALACGDMTDYNEPVCIENPEWGEDGWEPPGPEDPVWGEQLETKSRSMAQHALVLALRDVFASAAGKETELFAQDPAYKPADEQVLREADINVLEDPRAFLEVDESSVVFSSCPGIPIREIIADIARPAVLIWNKVGEVMPHDIAIRFHDPVSIRVKDMMEEYDEYEFPRDNVCFYGELAIYVRKR